MTFRFEYAELPVDDNVRKVAKSEFDRAMAEVVETGFEVHGTVRSVRRRLKRIRSVLRLIRPVFPDYRAENAALRETGAEFSALRDAQALVEAVDRLSRGRQGEVAAMLERLRRRLVQRAVAQETALDRDSFLAGIRAKLRDARVRSELWELQVVGMKAIVPGLVETYRLSRQALREALRQPDDEHLHEWRKMVKHHWSQLGLLRGLAPEFSEVRRQAAGRLAALLGNHHNLAVLKQALASESGLQDEADASLLDRLILAQMESLAERSLDLGRQLFEERPRAVARRWRGYWEDWRAAERLREAAL